MPPQTHCKWELPSAARGPSTRTFVSAGPAFLRPGRVTMLPPPAPMAPRSPPPSDGVTGRHPPQPSLAPAASWPRPLRLPYARGNPAPSSRRAWDSPRHVSGAMTVPVGQLRGAQEERWVTSASNSPPPFCPCRCSLWLRTRDCRGGGNAGGTGSGSRGLLDAVPLRELPVAAGTQSHTRAENHRFFIA